jgi:pimeloyl-ACP methyl ester carboxylesterase
VARPGRSARRIFAEYRLELLPDSGRFVPLEAPDAVVRAIETIAR